MTPRCEESFRTLPRVYTRPEPPHHKNRYNAPSRIVVNLFRTFVLIQMKAANLALQPFLRCPSGPADATGRNSGSETPGSHRNLSIWRSIGTRTPFNRTRDDAFRGGDCEFASSAKRDDHRRQQARLYDPGQVEARRSVVRFRYACGFRFRKDRAPGRSPFRF